LTILVSAGVVHAQPVSWPADRAPIAADRGSERGPLSLDAADPVWNAAATQGAEASRLPITLPAAIPGEPMQIGVTTLPPGGPITPGKSGVITREGAEIVWRVRVDAPQAAALRLSLTRLQLPDNGRLIVAGESMRLGYVIRGLGAMDTGAEWTPILDGPRALVEYRGPAKAGLPPITIDQISQIAHPWPRIASPIDLLPCEEDVQCQTVDATARDSVGWMVFTTQTGTFVCTGALLNDTDPLTTKGWLLTSRRCISTQASASSLTVYWFYQTPSCNGQPPDTASLPISQGATLLVQSTTSDVSFLQLAQDPAAGQGLAAWTTAEPTGTMWTIHHPLSSFKRVASGAGTTQNPICYGVQSPYQFHYLDYTLGTTEDGSTGAPLFDSQWRVVGQYYGVCSFQTPACDNPNQWNALFGKFSRSAPLVTSYLTGVVSPSRIYVNAAATGANTGLTWADAYTDLAAALAGICPPVGGTEVWVAEGTYKPAGVGAQSAFHLNSNVGLYGGFVGTETALSERNGAAHPTVLSGDLAGDDGPNFSNRSDNVHHVVLATGVNQTAVLDGFILKGGHANGSILATNRGGAMYVENGSPVISNCTFQDNFGSFGGALAAITGGNPNVQNCTFTANRAGAGGAVSLLGASGTFASCQFISNTSTGNGGAADVYDSNPVFTACLFRTNSVASRGGAVQMMLSNALTFTDCRFEQNAAGFGGGGVNSNGTTSTFTRCVFLQNTATFFSGALLQTANSQITVRASRFLGNSSGLEGGAINCNTGSLSLANCDFSGNRSTANSGGALFVTHQCLATVQNCTFSRNTAAIDGGGVAVDDGAANLTNCALWGNSDVSGSGENGQVRLVFGSLSVNYSDVQGLTGSLGGTGNIGGDPLFVSALGADNIAGTEDDDLAPGAGSAIIDAGDTAASMAYPTDLRGNSRRVDDLCRPDTGVGPAPIVDMGAIEGQGCVCYVNCDGSSTPPILTANDFQCFLNLFSQGDPGANCDGSSTPPVLTANDFQCFLNAFSQGCN